MRPIIPLSKSLILASNSPRRKELLGQMGFEFETVTRPIEENYPKDLAVEKIAAFIAEAKVKEFAEDRRDKLILSADTIVVSDGRVLGKPRDADDAREMLQFLSAKQHQVYTGICLAGSDGILTDSDLAQVTFRKLEAWEIHYYVDSRKPFDKAGAYGIQDWISLVGIESISGSYYTVMGLPTHRVYNLLRPYFLKNERIP